MKIFLVNSFLLVCLFTTQAQEKNLVVEGRVWSNLWEICESEYIIYTTFFNRFRGDTIVNEKLYKKVEVAEDEYAQQWKFSNELVREEDNRVYYLSDLVEEEVLLYDFNLKVGQGVTVWNILEPDGITFKVSKIDSVLTLDGYRKRMELELNEYSPTEIWIEGVGSESGVLNSGGGIFIGICNTSFLLCSSDDGFQVYQNPNYESCFYNLLGDDEAKISQEKIQLNYRPDSKILSIQNAENKSLQVMITSITGQVLYRTETNSLNYEIKLSNLNSGFYVVTLVGENFSTFKKIIVN